MNKKTTSIIVAVIVIAVIIVAVIGFNNRAKAPEVSGTNNSTTTAQQASSTAITSTTTATSTMTVTLSTSTPKTYSGSSFSFTYPGPWYIITPSPLVMTNFGIQYEAGGVIPPGGVQLTVVTTTISGNLDAIMATELANATQLTTTPVTVNGVACAKATYQVNYAPGATVQNVSVYCSHG